VPGPFLCARGGAEAAAAAAPFLDIEFEITGEAAGVEASATDLIHGQSGAKGFGICGGVENVRVRTTDGVTDFAVGEFGIAD
jgi:hypothetical protein